MIDALTSAQPGENVGFFLTAVGRDKDGDWATQHFGRGIAENVAGGVVPAHDDAVEVFGNDGVVGTGDDGGQELLRRELPGLFLETHLLHKHLMWITADTTP